MSSLFHRFSHLRRKPRPKVIKRGNRVYNYDTKRDTYRSDDGGILDVAIVASLLSGNSQPGYTSEDTHTPAPDFVPAGGETSGAGSVDSFAAPEPEPASESPSVSNDSGGISDSGGGGSDGGGE